MLSKQCDFGKMQKLNFFNSQNSILQKLIQIKYSWVPNKRTCIYILIALFWNLCVTLGVIPRPLSLDKMRRKIKKEK